MKQQSSRVFLCKTNLIQCYSNLNSIALSESERWNREKIHLLLIIIPYLNKKKISNVHG